LGDDPDVVDELITNGHKNQHEGGVFDFSLDPETMLLRQVFIQTLTASWDATPKRVTISRSWMESWMEHSTPTDVVKSHANSCWLFWEVPGDNTLPTEAEDNDVASMRLTGLYQPETVFMTDQALRFVATAKQLKFAHCLFTWHFMVAVPAATRGPVWPLFFICCAMTGTTNTRLWLMLALCILFANRTTAHFYLLSEHAETGAKCVISTPRTFSPVVKVALHVAKAQRVESKVVGFWKTKYQNSALRSQLRVCKMLCTAKTLTRWRKWRCSQWKGNDGSISLTASGESTKNTHTSYNGLPRKSGFAAIWSVFSLVVQWLGQQTHVRG
jgi:hypothetical protein